MRRVAERVAARLERGREHPLALHEHALHQLGAVDHLERCERRRQHGRPVHRGAERLGELGVGDRRRTR